MTAAPEPSFEILKDPDGHRYRVPTERVAEFTAAVAAIEHAKYGSKAWYRANDELNDKFLSFMVG